MPEKQQAVATDKRNEEVSKALAEAAVEAERKQLDEVEPGGRYVVNGQFVNAFGEPVKGQPTPAQREASTEFNGLATGEEK